MKLNHHPDSATLFAYAAGAVTEGFSLAVAGHLESCSDCRASVRDAELIGGQLLNEMPGDNLDDAALDQVWQRIADAPDPVRRAARKPAGPGELPGVLQEMFPNGLEDVAWRRLVPGIKQYLLPDVDSGNGSVRLLHIEPGVRIPHHTHGGSEMTLVLEGSFTDEHGSYHCGDLAELDQSVHHQPVVAPGQPCVCLIATDQRLKFTRVLDRVMQPLVGI